MPLEGLPVPGAVAVGDELAVALAAEVLAVGAPERKAVAAFRLELEGLPATAARRQATKKTRKPRN